MSENIVNEFHKLFYNEGDEIYGKVQYKGIPIQKCPLDLWIYQEIIWECRPEVIIETGTLYGGSALYLADLVTNMDLDCHIYTIDINSWAFPEHERITYITGDIKDFEKVCWPLYKKTENKKTMIILDSDHSYEHVVTELATFSPLVSVGQYLIVEDTNLNGHPVRTYWGMGPYEATETFINTIGKSFERDKSREKFLMTFNPNGYLKRVK